MIIEELFWILLDPRQRNVAICVFINQYISAYRQKKQMGKGCRTIVLQAKGRFSGIGLYMLGTPFHPIFKIENKIGCSPILQTHVKRKQLE